MALCGQTNTATCFRSGDNIASSVLDRLYEALTRNDRPEPADLIFVLAGRMERKKYGLDLYRAGLASRLILSIGRFEVSKLARIGFKAPAELIELRDSIPPEERHFFLEMNAAGVRVEKVTLRRWSTYGELLALRDRLVSDPACSLLIISTGIHLRRVTLTLERLLGNSSRKILYCAVPVGYGSLKKEKWWTRREDRRYVVSEAFKLAGYRLILAMPDWAIRRLMRLKG
jgi:uncharacterized SAM-binding protein YcdF (DUF218 family)